MDEWERYQNGVIPHDLGPITPEQIAIQALIDLLTQKQKESESWKG